MSKAHVALNPARWAGTRYQVFERDGWRCTRCGKAGRLEAHHVIPLIHGGTRYELSNIRTLCRACHIAHHKPVVSEAAKRWTILVDAMAK